MTVDELGVLIWAVLFISVILWCICEVIRDGDWT